LAPRRNSGQKSGWRWGALDAHRAKRRDPRRLTRVRGDAEPGRCRPDECLRWVLGCARADLKLEGIVSSPGHAINNAYRGKPYSYKVRADFEPAKGTGRRLGKRKCDFAFVPQK
jgi:hypothetical protein